MTSAVPTTSEAISDRRISAEFRRRLRLRPPRHVATNWINGPSVCDRSPSAVVGAGDIGTSPEVTSASRCESSPQAFVLDPKLGRELSPVRFDKNRAVRKDDCRNTAHAVVCRRNETKPFLVATNVDEVVLNVVLVKKPSRHMALSTPRRTVDKQTTACHTFLLCLSVKFS